ncbi:hypothetical protein ACIP5N_22145 [Streptomyces sp. NPDC088768]|uniref:hypothetical protein n=1 Tax=Streptomyces sp. NPDC088768 TaxID=3365894 RepID=UPI003804BA9B
MEYIRVNEGADPASGREENTMGQLPVETTVHRVFGDGLVEDLVCPKGLELARAIDFVEKVLAKGHWVVIVPDGDSGLISEVSLPIGSDLLSEIVGKAINAGFRVLVLPEVIDRSVIPPVLQGLPGKHP